MYLICPKKLYREYEVSMRHFRLRAVPHMQTISIGDRDADPSSKPSVLLYVHRKNLDTFFPSATIADLPCFVSPHCHNCRYEYAEFSGGIRKA